MITPIGYQTAFHGKNLKLARKLVNVDKHAPKGLTKCPLRFEADKEDTNSFVAGVAYASLLSILAVGISNFSERSGLS